MLDSSELDYLRTLLGWVCSGTTIKHFSEARSLANINDTSKMLVFPGELINNDGKFYTKRYKIKISESSELAMTTAINAIINGIDSFNRNKLADYGADWTYKSNSFLLSGEMTDPTGICWDREFFWVVGNTNRAVYKYSAAGVYQSISFSVASEMTSPTGVCWDGEFFWICDVAIHTVFKYNPAGIYQGISFSTSSEGNDADGITWDGEFFWVLQDANKAVYKYSAAGVYQSISFSVAGEITSPNGIYWDGSYFWISCGSNDKIYKYDSAGTYLSLSYDTPEDAYAPLDSFMMNMCEANGDFWLIGYRNKRVYEYEKAYILPSILCYLSLRYSNSAFEDGQSKVWFQDIYIDVEWCVE